MHRTHTAAVACLVCVCVCVRACDWVVCVKKLWHDVGARVAAMTFPV